MPNGGTIYAIGVEGSSLVKIGCTTGTVEKRLQSLQTGQPFSLHVLAAIPIDTHVQRIERQVHAFLAQERRRGEWFDIAFDAEALAALVVRAVQFVQQHEEEDQTPKPRYRSGLGKAIRHARLDQALSQLDLSARTGISQKYLSRVENDKADPSWSIVRRLVAALDLDLRPIAREEAADA
jgi:DNA-binding XRE family transcriptional regulator